MIMTSVDLLKNNPSPTEEEIRRGIEGNLCRCTGYQNIVKAIQYAAKEMAGCRLPEPPDGGSARMYPAQFEYVAPASLDEAIKLLAESGGEAKILAGGHSLLPAMKLRLASRAR